MQALFNKNCLVPKEDKNLQKRGKYLENEDALSSLLIL
jgi:hypothetical protein